MRISLSESSKLKLLELLKKENNCKTISELSSKFKIKQKTFESWFYIEKTTLPADIFEEYLNKITITEKKENNWGQILGGKIGYNAIIKKFGKEEVHKLNSIGGKNAAKIRDLAEADFQIDLDNPSFLEIYGALIGDGWLCKPHQRNKWSMGLCGNLKLDKEYIYYCSKILSNLLKRKGYFYERPKMNVIEFRFQHKRFFKLLNEQLKFPAGIKENIKIPERIYLLNFDKLKYVIRGIFDTDGSFFLDKGRKVIPNYPIISIHMKEPILLNQIVNILKLQGFKPVFEESNNQIRLNGSAQLKKWMEEIGSSNSKHLNKINKFLETNNVK